MSDLFDNEEINNSLIRTYEVVINTYKKELIKIRNGLTGNFTKEFDQSLPHLTGFLLACICKDLSISIESDDINKNAIECINEISRAAKTLVEFIGVDKH